MALAGTLAINNAIAGVFSAAQPTPSPTNTWYSLHTATTGTTGASEYAGVTRIQYSVGAPAAGSITNTASASFTTSGVTPVTHGGTWDASTVGNFRIGAPLGSSVTATTILFAIGSQTFNVA